MIIFWQTYAPNLLANHIEHNLPSPSREEYDRAREQIMKDTNKKPEELTVFDGFNDAQQVTGPQECVLALFLSTRRKDSDSDETYLLEDHINILLSSEQRERRNTKTGNSGEKRESLNQHCAKVKERLQPAGCKALIAAQIKLAEKYLYYQPGRDREEIYQEYLEELNRKGASQCPDPQDLEPEVLVQEEEQHEKDDE